MGERRTEIEADSELSTLVIMVAPAWVQEIENNYGRDAKVLI